MHTALRCRREDRGGGTYSVCIFCFSSRSFLRLTCIIRHVKFSMRCWFGSWDFVRLYSFHIWVARGSFFCISSVLSTPSGEAPSFQSEKTASRRNSPREILFLADGSSLPSSKGAMGGVVCGFEVAARLVEADQALNWQQPPVRWTDG